MIRSVCREAAYSVRRSQRRGTAAVIASEKAIHVEQVNEDPPEEDLYV